MTFDRSAGYVQRMASAAADPARCDVCGASPARRTLLRSYVGLILPVFERKHEATLCKWCGTAAQRDLSARSMTRGWWSLPSLVWVPVGLFLNYLEQRKFDRLEDPRGATGPALPVGHRPVGRPLALLTTLVVGVPVGGFVLLAAYFAITGDY
jgi:hypothetical protein